ncbi:MAG: hormogonium polysaccharide biosynthesis glycosyltransferase HpsO [Leptolyngbyaceae bacterium]|nr:hormogonium polysaccharide biosynthesis glycosyltransferase HpsO [Leptolyngbyaceae bacterium]
MRILIASHTYIVRLNCEKFKTLSVLSPDIEVTIVVPKRWRPGGVQNRVVESEPWQEGNFRVVPIANFSQNNQGLLTFSPDLITLLRQFRPHIIQTEQGAKALAQVEMIALNRMLKLGAKLLFFTWWNIPYTLTFPVSWLERYNLSHTHGIISGNQEGADILRERGFQGEIRVLPQLGVDEALFQQRQHPDLATQLGIQPDEFVVGFVGRFVEEKGLLTLFKALGQLSDRPWKCLMVGRGPLKETLVRQAEAGGWGDRLIWVESVPHDDVPRYINLMSTLVLPSETTYQFKTLTAVGWKEQFGHVLIEAMACRVPVIGSDSGEIPHVIDQAGLIFPEGDGDALGDRLIRLMENPQLADDLGDRGYERVLAHYTNRALAKKHLEFYEDLLKT